MTRIGLVPSPNSLQARIRAALTRYPCGLTSAQLAEHLDTAPYTVSSVASKMAAYGVINKVKDRTIATKTLWRSKMQAA